MQRISDQKEPLGVPNLRPTKKLLMPGYRLLLLGLFCFFSPDLRAQAIRYDTLVSTSIGYLHDTLLLGQPAFIYFIIRNRSNDTIFVEEGGDYRSGKCESVKLHIISPQGDTLKERELYGIGGGFIGFEMIPPKQARKIKLFLPMWGNITTPGTYKISVSKDFRVNLLNPRLTASRDSFNAKIQVVPKCTVRELQVLEDKVKLGLYLDQLLAEIQYDTKGAVADGSVFRNPEKSSIPQTLYDNLRILSEIKDERVVPFLDEALRTEQHLTKAKAAMILGNFPDSDLALEALIFAASGEENTRCQVFGDSIHLVLTTADARQNALRGIMQHHRSTALDFLLAKKDDPYPYEREYILSRAPTLMPAAAAKRICASFLTDKHPVIRRKAQASLDYLETVGRKNK